VNRAVNLDAGSPLDWPNPEITGTAAAIATNATRRILDITAGRRTDFLSGVNDSSNPIDFAFQFFRRSSAKTIRRDKAIKGNRPRSASFITNCPFWTAVALYSFWTPRSGDGAELLWSMQRLFVHPRFPTTTPSPSTKRQRAAGAPHHYCLRTLQSLRHSG